MKYELSVLDRDLTRYETKLRDDRSSLFRALEAAELQTITGLVGPAGSAGSMYARFEAQETLRVDMHAWRRGRGPVRYQPMTLLRPVSGRELAAAMELYQPGRVVRLRVRFGGYTVGGIPHALLHRLVSTRIGDQELIAEWKKLCKPVHVRDPVLGTLTLNRRLGALEGEATWMGSRVRVSAPGATHEEHRHALETGRKLWRASRGWNAKIRKCAVAHLLDLANEWAMESANDAGEPPPKRITSAAFVSRLRLETVSLECNDHFSFWYDGRDLFWGHGIVVGGNLKDGPTGAEIFG